MTPSLTVLKWSLTAYDAVCTCHFSDAVGVTNSSHFIAMQDAGYCPGNLQRCAGQAAGFLGQYGSGMTHADNSWMMHCHALL